MNWFRRLRPTSRRPAVAAGAPADVLEPRRMLTTYTVDTLADGFGGPAGSISLAEAIRAAETDAPFGDAPAGSGADRIVFDPSLSGSLRRFGTRITTPLTIDASAADIRIENDVNEIFEIDVDAGDRVVIRGFELFGRGSGSFSPNVISVVGEGNVRLDNLDIGISGFPARGFNSSVIEVDGATTVLSNSRLSGRPVNGALILIRSGTVTTLGTELEGGRGRTVRIRGGRFVAAAGSELRAAGQVLTFEDDSVATAAVVDGARLVGLDTNINRGGVFVTADSRLTVRNASIENFTSGIVSEGRVLLDGATLTDNGRGLAVGEEPNSGPPFANGGNTGFGGAVYSTGTLTALNSTFEDNRAGSSGGAIAVAGGTAFIDGSTFTNNDAFRTDNPPNARPSGGALSILGGSATVIRSTLQDNSADLGGAILVTRGSTLRLFESDVRLNQTFQGGAVANYGTLFSRGTTFFGNAAIDDGGAIYARGELTRIYGGSTFTSNSADVGGAIFASGGQIFLEDVILGTADAGNLSNIGGGLAVPTGNRPSQIQLRDVTIEGNRATTDGGGLFIGEGKTVFLFDSLLDGNTAARGPGAFLEPTAQLFRRNLSGDDAIEQA